MNLQVHLVNKKEHTEPDRGRPARQSSSHDKNRNHFTKNYAESCPCKFSNANGKIEIISLKIMPEQMELVPPGVTPALRDRGRPARQSSSHDKNRNHFTKNYAESCPCFIMQMEPERSHLQATPALRDRGRPARQSSSHDKNRNHF